jgi:phosphoglycolate phosphatase-like HAD superfamily hydrolase
MTIELVPPLALPKYPATIFDMDGTLCDVTSVRHHVIERPKNFDAFHYGSLFCPGIDWVLEEVDYHRRAGNMILVVTAREERWRSLTQNWLDDHGVPVHELFMRPTGDFRSDVLIKGEILDSLLPRYDIRHAYDDNPSIIGLWKARGVPHTVVPGWAG